MRRLVLLALLTVSPSFARADGLPGTSTYPLTGCHSVGLCVSLVVNQTGPDGSGMLPRYYPTVTCYGVPDCQFAGHPSMWVYGQHGELLFRFQAGRAFELEEFPAPRFAVLEIQPLQSLGDGSGNVTTWGSRELVLVTTPEPGTLTLLGTGIIGLAGAVRRRRRT